MVPEFRDDQISWVTQHSEFLRLKEILSDSFEVAFDLETTGLDEFAKHGDTLNGGVAARIVMAQFSIRMVPGEPWVHHYVLPLSHPQSPFMGEWRFRITEVAQHLNENCIPLIGHNVRFDLRHIFRHTGVDLSHLLEWDTQISAHLLDETASTGLKAVASKTFNIPLWNDFSLTVPGAAERVALYQLGAYGARDTYYSGHLADNHRRRMFLKHEDPEDRDYPQDNGEIENARLGRLATWISMPLASAITATEQRGIYMDREWIEKELIIHEQGEKEFVKKLEDRYPNLLTDIGTPIPTNFAPTATYFKAWTARAIAAGDLRVTALTKKGNNPQWDRAVLIKQARAGSDAAIDLLALRSHVKKSQFLRSWLNLMVQEKDQQGDTAWVIHPKYNVGSVATGRLSSNSPNIQQVTQTLRSAFMPRPGYAFIDLDYSQVELRVAAYASQCVPMIEAFRTEKDLHTLLAANLNNKRMDEVTKEERQIAKQCNFGLLYGMQVEGFQSYVETNAGIVLTTQQAAETRKGFFDMWTGLTQWHIRSVENAYRTGQAVNILGRVRRLPGLYSHDHEARSGAERIAINSPIQGFASDLMQMAIASISGRLPGFPPVPDAHIVLTVHDNIGIEVPLDPVRGRKAILECRKRMEEIANVMFVKMECRFDIPLVVDIKAGSRWSLNDLYELFFPDE